MRRLQFVQRVIWVAHEKNKQLRIDYRIFLLLPLLPWVLTAQIVNFMNLSVDLSLYYLSQGSINNVVEKRGGFCGLELLSKTRLKSLMHFWVSLWPALPFYLMLSNTKLLVWQGEIWISFISSIVVEKTLFFEVLDHIICHFFEKCLD